MKNFYKILGVEKDTPVEVIKKTYKKLALINHPDKGGDNEAFKSINEAYTVLCDENERKKYDQDFSISQFSIDEADLDEEVSGLLMTAGVSFSQEFKKQHQKMIGKYQAEPLQAGNVRDSIKKMPDADLYKYSKLISCEDIFSYVKLKNRDNPHFSVPLIDTGSLTLENTVGLFIRFLQGDIYGKALTELCKRLGGAIENMQHAEIPSGEIEPLSAIRNILLMAEGETELCGVLLTEMARITDYAMNDTERCIHYLAPLFQSKYFRALHHQALHQYWVSEQDVLDEESLGKLSNHEKVDGYIEKIKDIMLKNREDGQTNDHLVRLQRYLRLLNRLDRVISERPDVVANSASFFRDKAFLILDWMPAILAASSQAIAVNTLLQAGVYFQKAASLEKEPAIRMADEKIALYVYINAQTVALKATPDIELYVYTHCLKFLTAAHYNSPELEELVAAFQHRSAVIADIYPFFIPYQSNMDFQVQEDRSIALMRGLLHELTRIISVNSAIDEEKWEQPRLAIDHEYVTVFNQAYEACLKHWYEKIYNPETEKAFRLKLMQELLAINEWTFLDLDYNLRAPWIMIRRDEQGWIAPSRALPFVGNTAVSHFSSMDGLEINSNTGEINFIFKKWKQGDPTYKNLMSIMDLGELFRTRISSAFFSLDPVDPDMPHHPFNQMRFGPKSVCQTQLFHTMLVTDYLLKFFTVGSEVQGQFPYDFKSIDGLVRDLPDYLKKIITDIQRASHSEAAHRFWIEAQETVPVAVADEKLASTGISRYAVGDVRMVIKKHVMVRDVSGNLIDKSEDDEGWVFYVLSPFQKRQIERGERVIEGPAIICIEGTNNLYFIEDGVLSEVFYLENCDHHLYRLFGYARTAEHQIILDETSSHTIYRLTRESAKQSGRSHHYSPEYIFAREFTLHYNEFAMYFPEFGRLRELSKAMVLVRIMSSQREINQQKIDLCNKLLNGSDEWIEFEKKARLDAQEKVAENFSSLRNQFSTRQIEKSCEERLREIKGQIGPLKFYSYSPEIIRQRDELYEENKRIIISKHGYEAWNYNSSHIWSEINAELPAIAEKLSNLKYQNWKDELLRHFRGELSGCYNASSIVSSFLDGNSAPLLRELSRYNESSIHREIQKNYPKSSLATIGQAINGSTQAIKELAVIVANTNIERQKEFLRAEIVRHGLLERSFQALGFGAEESDEPPDNTCWWVPASIRHESGVRMVYGGVNISPQIAFMQPNNANGQALLNQAFTAQTQARLSSAQILRQNQAVGNAFRDHVADYFRQNGYDVKTEVYKSTSIGGRRIDVEVWKDGVCLGGIETKTGRSRYTASQRAKDILLGLGEIPYKVNMVRKK